MARDRIPLAVPALHGNELRYLQECVLTNWVSYLGPFVTRFEGEFGRRVGGNAVAVNSGTAALHLALLVAGVGPGDAVIVPDLTFIAPANAIRYCGADAIFVDVDRELWQIDAAKVAAFLEHECETREGAPYDRVTGKRIRAILPVHLLGHPSDIEPLRVICRRFGLALVEDATESLGSSYRGQPIGADAELACFSFNGNKIITCGGGGMVLARDRAVADRVRYLSTQARDSVTEYKHEAIGFNYRLTNLQAAVGLAQLERLDEHVARKREIAAAYREGLADVPGVRLPIEAPWASSTFWLYTILVDRPAPRDSRELIAALGALGIEARPVWAPLHRQRPYRKSRAYRIENSTWIYERAVSLPSSVDLSPDDQRRVISDVRRALAFAGD